MPTPTSRNAKHLTTSVLQHLERYARAAALRNDRRTLEHFEECWLLVFTRLYGGYSLPVCHRRSELRAPAAAVPASKPHWHALKYSRPARRVTAQITEGGAKGRRLDTCPAVYDVLACGHKIAAAYKEDGSRVSKWRYCNECAQEARAAADVQRVHGTAA